MCGTEEALLELSKCTRKTLETERKMLVCYLVINKILDAIAHSKINY